MNAESIPTVPPADLFSRLRVLTGIAWRPVAVATVAAAACAFLASGGRLGPAVVAALLGIAGGVISFTLTMTAPESRSLLAWPRLAAAGWAPPVGERAPGVDACGMAPRPLGLYAAGETALSYCRLARRVLGVRAGRFRRRVVEVVRKGEAAHARAELAREFFATAETMKVRDSLGERDAPVVDGEGRDRLAQVVAESGKARQVRAAQVRQRLAEAEAELQGAIQILGDLSLRLSGIAGELSSVESERRQLLPGLARLHEEMSALERAAQAPLAATIDSESRYAIGQEVTP